MVIYIQMKVELVFYSTANINDNILTLSSGTSRKNYVFYNDKILIRSLDNEYNQYTELCNRYEIIDNYSGSYYNSEGIKILYISIDGNVELNNNDVTYTSLLTENTLKIFPFGDVVFNLDGKTAVFDNGEKQVLTKK
ncbi:hypothetical protein [Brachyspira sp. G79]|uniref:hypothetical protein n=1 Tax=Brachyspira sp. G79 TaxID=1358104 RepID=UPI000BBBE263|nr:hypothetical protein [Brachyspira sp. G79]